jgi:predicted GNAT family acetyltransferase
MAIASGGASFYRNRINTYLKQDMSQEEAEAKAWADFSKISDEAQQSGDPALVSQQQASVLGRLVLAFQNTPMQYTRLIKKAGLDIINGRGDFKTNFSKIIYYGAVQNFIFSALQNALFAMIPGFDDEEETEEKRKLKEDQKTGRIIHSMVDTILRGSGLAGAVVTTAKNTIRKFVEQDKKGFTADHTYTIIEAANISPPIGSKLRKLYGAIQTWKFDKDVIKERGFDVTLEGKLNISPTYNIIGNLTSALLNLPLDRALMEVEGLVEALDERNTKYQRIALALGWRTWGVGAKNEEEDLIKDAARARRKEEGKEKAKETRRVNKDALYNLELNIDGDNFIEYYNWKKGKSIKDKIEWLKSKNNE